MERGPIGLRDGLIVRLRLCGLCVIASDFVSSGDADTYPVHLAGLGCTL